MKLKKGTLLFLLLTCLAYTTLAQEVGYELKNTDVDIDDNGKITNYKSSNTNIIIPEKIGDITITGIGDEAFKVKSLVAVAFAADSEVKTIGASAFQNNQIATLTLPTTLTTIGNNAFQGNDSEDAGGNKITTLTLPPSLTVIGDSAFYNNSLTTVTFNDDPNKSKIKNIEKDAFSGNTKLNDEGITLPKHAGGDDVRYKDSEGNDYDPNDDNKNTFTNFDRSLVAVIPTHTLTADDVDLDEDGKGIITKCHCGNFVSNSIEIPVQIGGKTITGIADKSWPNGIFKEKNLVAVVFEEGSKVTAIGTSAFENNQLTTLTLPPSLESIKESSFHNNQIATLTLPTTLTTIGEFAFWDNQITELTLPEGLTVIGGLAFASNQLTTLTLPATVTTIGWGAFYNNYIKELSLPTSLTTIGEGAFWKNQITTLTFPENAQLTTIGNWAFRGNEDDGGNQLTTLALPPSLTLIGDSAFYNNSLTTVTFNDDPNKSKIKNIEKDAFSGNTGLTGITFPNHVGGDDVRYKDSEGNDYDPNDDNKNTFTNFDRSLVAVIPTHTLTVDDVDLDDKGIITKCHCGNFVSNSIEIPVEIDGKTITGIAYKSSPDKGIFEDKNLIAVAFEEGSQITSIGNNAFLSNNITTLSLPTVLTTIGSYAFANNQITELTFPDDSQLTTIGDGAFYDNNITELTLPPSLEAIRQYAFSSNTLESFTLPSVTKEGFRTYWQDNNLADLGTSPTILKADFEKPFELVSIEQVTLTLTIHGDGVGLVEGLKAGDNPVDKGQPLTLTAKPNGGNELEKWVFGSDISTSTSTYTIPAEETQNDLRIEVHFKKNSFNDPVELTISTDGQGTVTPNIGINTYEKGTMVDLTATPDEGWRFDKWVISDEQDKTDNPTIVTVDVNKTATAHFVQLVTLTTSVEGQQGGTISTNPKPSLEGNQYDSKTEVTLTATSNEGWRFDKWVITGEEENNDNPTDVTVDVNKTVTAHFVQQVTLTLTIEETGASNVVSGLSAGENKIDKGADFKLKAMLASGQRFVSWTIGVETIVTEEYTLPATDTEDDISITVTFEAIPQQVTLTLAIEGEGSINPLVKPNSVDPDNEMKGMYDINTEIELTATPNEGWRFDKWVISDEENKTDKTTTITLDKNKTVTAHFVEGEEEEAITSILTEVVSATPYPNPVTSQITLKAKDGDLIQLFSQKGKQQYSTQHTGNEAHTIDASTIPVGVYLMRITDAEGNTTTKRIVKK